MIFFICLSFNKADASTTYYTYTNIGYLTYWPNIIAKTEGTSINNSATIVGISQYELNNHAFMWSNGTMTDLGNLGYDRNVIAWGINNSGQIVGQSSVSGTTSGYVTHAFLYDQGVMSDLGTLGGRDSFANSINNNGQIVGYSATTDGNNHAFSYANNTMTDLGTLQGANYSVASSINDRGQIVGYSGSQAFIYDTGVMTGLGFLDGGNQSYAFDINDAGYVVGASQMLNGTRNAFLYADGQMLNLGAINGDSEARAINNLNQVVGTTGDRAFIWSSQDGMIDLNSLLIPQSGISPELAIAMGINDYGQIVCQGPMVQGQYNWTVLRSTYLLTPTSVVPLPSAVWFLASGFLGAVVMRNFIARRNQSSS
jgi:probable HAF family extracellular repeat protein